MTDHPRGIAYELRHAVVTWSQPLTCRPLLPWSPRDGTCTSRVGALRDHYAPGSPVCRHIIVIGYGIRSLAAFGRAPGEPSAVAVHSSSADAGPMLHAVTRNLDLGVFVGGVVVGHDVQLHPRVGLGDLCEELEELLMAWPKSGSQTCSSSPDSL